MYKYIHKLCLIQQWAFLDKLMIFYYCHTQHWQKGTVVGRWVGQRRPRPDTAHQDQIPVSHCPCPRGARSSDLLSLVSVTVSTHTHTHIVPLCEAVVSQPRWLLHCTRPFPCECLHQQIIFLLPYKRMIIFLTKRSCHEIIFCWKLQTF